MDYVLFARINHNHYSFTCISFINLKRVFGCEVWELKKLLHFLLKKHIFFAFKKCGVYFKRMVP